MLIVSLLRPTTTAVMIVCRRRSRTLLLQASRRRRFHSAISTPIHGDKQDDVARLLLATDLDLHFLSDEKTMNEMRENVARRKGVGDVDLVKQLYDNCQSDGWRDVTLKERFVREALKVPNRCHPSLLTVSAAAVSSPADPVSSRASVEPSKEFHEIAEEAGCLRRSGIGAVVGGRSYFLLGALAQLEDALCKYTLQFLASNGFQLVSVPDILRPEVIEACGMAVQQERTQLYSLDRQHYGAAFLSGTSEMALAALFSNEVIPHSDLPLKLCAVSRCFRAETSRLKEESGIFRVHQFTKVEMFSLTPNETETESNKTLEEFVSIQTQLFSSLGLDFRVVDMPPNELGAAAYRKFDVEAWMAGRRLYGEVSSASNCTDYQSRRLNIRYGQKCNHVHTVNGTACAVPRMLIALIETHQQSDGYTVTLPAALRPYFKDNATLSLRPKSGRLRILRRADGSR